MLSINVVLFHQAYPFGWFLVLMDKLNEFALLVLVGLRQAFEDGVSRHR